MSAAAFKDHFSGAAKSYAAYRPSYPASLFEWLTSQSPGTSHAWDAGTGNGQAAVALADRFDRVTATDPSADQIANAQPHPRVTYAVARAEAGGLATSSCDLVTAAQALHWFDRTAFFAEARRVLVPRGLIAIWTYVEPVLDDERLDPALQEFAAMARPYWPPERVIAESGYRTVSFPFDEIAAPRFEMHLAVTRESLAGYLRTWSATKRFVAQRGSDPVVELEQRLSPDWPAGERKLLRWTLHVRAGRNTRL